MNTPSNLNGKKIILGITGSIAAYKAAFLVRLLIKAGAEVQVLMTEAATKFITPLTLATLSKNPVHTQVSSESSWNNHVEMGLWADAMVVAPLTATTLSKMAHGNCDNMIVATYLSARCPVFFAPAMDLDMWVHPATLDNVKRLTDFGNHLVNVGHGELASGLVGAGRMAEPEEIVARLHDFFKPNAALPLYGKKMIVTAGPTYEAIDPVRYIGNHSSGKMGICIADELAAQGATVSLILGPSIHKASHPNVTTLRVTSAQEMYERAAEEYKDAKAGILAAAVADYRPKEYFDKKMKKNEGDLKIELARTKDIAAELGAVKENHQLLIGFALETNNEIENAKGKLTKKNFDFIVLNSLQDKGAGFKHDTNKITILDRYNNIERFELKSKAAVAKDIVKKIIELCV